eukprot:TRINITY_DN11109_c0_g1_i2.p1 TRINITY_DN11109_c0_g1~~TRINITY_DN11109_c0_g1_i2.p1  ORF type:complete len:877 (+),score=81.44 TRINITY_DN11109_c0_g1_i2:79-2709(+)
MPRLTLVCGMPFSGKSVYVAQHCSDLEHITGEPDPKALLKSVIRRLQSGASVVIDSCENGTDQWRRVILLRAREYAKGCRVETVVVRPSGGDLQRSWALRWAMAEGKSVTPPTVFRDSEQRIAGFSYPTNAEGFDGIATHWQPLSKSEPFPCEALIVPLVGALVRTGTGLRLVDEQHKLMAAWAGIPGEPDSAFRRVVLLVTDREALSRRCGISPDEPVLDIIAGLQLRFPVYVAEYQSADTRKHSSYMPITCEYNLLAYLHRKHRLDLNACVYIATNPSAVQVPRALGLLSLAADKVHRAAALPSNEISPHILAQLAADFRENRPGFLRYIAPAFDTSHHNSVVHFPLGSSLVHSRPAQSHTTETARGPQTWHSTSLDETILHSLVVSPSAQESWATVLSSGTPAPLEATRQTELVDAGRPVTFAEVPRFLFVRSVIAEFFGSSTFIKAREYKQQRMLLDETLSLTLMPTGNVVAVCKCRGRSEPIYEVKVVLNPIEGPQSCTCNCPVGQDRCKHAATIALEVWQLVTGERDDDDACTDSALRLSGLQAPGKNFISEAMLQGKHDKKVADNRVALRATYASRPPSSGKCTQGIRSPVPLHRLTSLEDGDAEEPPPLQRQGAYLKNDAARPDSPVQNTPPRPEDPQPTRTRQSALLESPTLQFILNPRRPEAQHDRQTSPTPKRPRHTEGQMSSPLRKSLFHVIETATSAPAHKQEQESIPIRVNILAEDPDDAFSLLGRPAGAMRLDFTSPLTRSGAEMSSANPTGKHCKKDIEVRANTLSGEEPRRNAPGFVGLQALSRKDTISPPVVLDNDFLCREPSAGTIAASAAVSAHQPDAEDFFDAGALSIFFGGSQHPAQSSTTSLPPYPRRRRKRK